VVICGNHSNYFGNDKATVNRYEARGSASEFCSNLIGRLERHATTVVVASLERHYPGCDRVDTKLEGWGGCNICFVGVDSSVGYHFVAINAET
jgi:hypothetical protein